jgi:hypothetical protein
VSTTRDETLSQVPGPYRGLVDDAAIFPPGDAPVPSALEDHRAHLASEYGALVGGFVVDDVRLAELVRCLAQEAGPAGAALAVHVVVSAGAGAIEPAVRRVVDASALELRALEVALRDPDDLAQNARRVTVAVDQLVQAGSIEQAVTVFVEPPPLPSGTPSSPWLEALDEIAAADLRLKLRTGGPSADSFPGADELAAALGAALDRELAFKCTAGLHHAVRHRDPETGFEHHGFLNVLLATRASLDGAGAGDVAELLELTDAGAVTSRLAEVGDTSLAGARRWFTSFGSCSVTDPVHDLRALGLLSPSAADAREPGHAGRPVEPGQQR